MRQTRLHPEGPFSLREQALFGFGYNFDDSYDGTYRLAFRTDADLDSGVGVVVREDGDDLVLDVHGQDGAGREVELDDEALAAAARQAARIMSCDVDARPYVDLGRRDPVVGALQAAAPGLRPPLFCSAYEGAVWAILAQRTGRAQAGRLRSRLVEQCGTTFEMGDRSAGCLPGPTALLGVTELPGLPAVKLPRLHAIAQAALDGELDTPTIAARATTDPDGTTADLQRLPGIGPFSSSLIIVRACGLADAEVMGEARGRELTERLYGVPADSSGDDAYRRLAETWRPYRTWVAVLIRAVTGRLDEHEINELAARGREVVAA